MASRMDRYYNDESNFCKRTSKNAELYRAIYDNAQYDNVEGVTSIDRGKEINMNDVRKLLQSREERSRSIIKPAAVEVNNLYEEEEKSYDINDIIDRAKEERVEEVKTRSLGETQIISLKDLISKSDKTYKKNDNDEQELKEIINTIYTTSLLKKESVGGLFDDLRSSGNTIIQPDIQNVISKSKDDIESVDNSFYTSSLGFKKNDFEEIKEMEEKVKKSNKSTTIILVILSLLFVISVLYIVFKIWV